LSANPHWARWIFASLSKHFESKRDGVKFFIEGDDSSTAAHSDYFEFRTNGPYFSEKSKDWWDIQVTVNVLVVHKRSDVSIHTFHANLGKMVAAFEKSISVFRFGTGPDDNQERLGCLQLLVDKENSIQVDHFGQVSPDTKEMQCMVQGTYCMYLEV
jgi:hypothetical protein